ncbi:MAG TPA: hypothetical protein VGV59_12355, partial [Pyrinomonadaceae bacterium]|nr:hypothetical protein [Pyrinomonadaceae bacterium]
MKDSRQESRAGSRARRERGASRVFALVPCCLFLSSSQSALAPAGPQAGRIGGHWWLMLYTLTGVFLLVMLVLLSAVLRARRQRALSQGDEPETRPDPARERRMMRVVVASVAATVVVLFVLLVSSFLTGRSLASIAVGEDVMTVKVTGHQWWW